MTPARIETAAPGDVREVLDAWFEAITPERNDSNTDTDTYRASVVLEDRFYDMLDAHAYLDAVMLMVPEGYRIKMTICADGRGAADVWVHAVQHDPVGPSKLYAHPALALAAAILRAKETDDD